MSTREQATIRKARYGVEEDHGILVLEIACDFGGSGQSFQACVDDKLGSEMVREVCALFGVATVDALVGRRCFALRLWPTFNEPIEGFEVDGKRWTKSACVKRHAPEHYRDPFEYRSETIRDHIKVLARDIERRTGDLERLRGTYVDWTADEKGTGT